MLAKIPVDAGLYETIQHRPVSPHHVLVPVRSLSHFVLRLTDHDGNAIDLQGMDFSMTLVFHFTEAPVTPVTQQKGAVQDHALQKYIADSRQSAMARFRRIIF